MNKQLQLQHNAVFEEQEKARAEEKIKLEKQKAEEIVAAKLAERDKIIADMSHRIKNIINKLASPLRQLKSRKNAMTINKALKGADLIREIINGFNYSYSGSFNDFIFDAKKNRGRRSLFRTYFG